MIPMKPEITVYTTATGVFVLNGPANTELRPGQSSTPLPEGFSDETHVWDAAQRAYVINVLALRSRRWTATKNARDRAEWSGCLTPLGRVDTDPDSQRKVSGSVQMAMIAQAAGVPFNLAWTMQDNGTVMHDAPAMIAMGVAVGQHVAACHAVALAKRDEIAAAGDVTAIDAVDLEGGWPGAPA